MDWFLYWTGFYMIGTTVTKDLSDLELSDID